MSPSITSISNLVHLLCLRCVAKTSFTHLSQNSPLACLIAWSLLIRSPLLLNWTDGTPAVAHPIYYDRLRLVDSAPNWQIQQLLCCWWFGQFLEVVFRSVWESTFSFPSFFAPASWGHWLSSLLAHYSTDLQWARCSILCPFFLFTQ